MGLCFVCPLRCWQAFGYEQGLQFSHRDVTIVMFAFPTSTCKLISLPVPQTMASGIIPQALPPGPIPVRMWEGEALVCSGGFLLALDVERGEGAKGCITQDRKLHILRP